MDSVSIDVLRMDVDQLKALRSKIDSILDGSGDKIGDLDSVLSEMKTLKNKVAETGKAAVSRAIRSFLEKRPEVESIRWTQYTPYFNDGEPCEFSVHEVEVKLVGDDEEGGDREDGYLDRYSLSYDARNAKQPEPTELIRDMQSLSSLFEQAEDAMKATFGDHVQVTVGRVGDAEVEEYEHD